MFSCLRIETKTKEETPFMKNGRLLLEELITSCDGKCNPICTFSSKELAKATENYHKKHMIVLDRDFKLYKGFLHGRPISVKKYDSRPFAERLDMYWNSLSDIVIGSQMSAHRNVLKVIGCCLETKIPMVVYEFAGDQALSDHILQGTNMAGATDRCSRPLSWKSRIKIAVDIARAISYLHTALSRTVVLRDIRPSIIILGEDCVPKLADFSLSVYIPEGESYVITDVHGRIGCIAPEYLFSGYVTDKLDVYYFGLFLLQLLTGQSSSLCLGNELYFQRDCAVHHIENQRLIEIVDPAIVYDDREQQELLAFGKLGVRCMRDKAEERPTMTDVGRELERIYRSVPSLL